MGFREDKGEFDMIRPSPMEQINMIIFDTDIDVVTEEIINLGILHLMDIAEIASWSQDLRSAKAEDAISKYSELSKKIKGLSRKLGINEQVTQEQKKIRPLDVNEIEEALNKIDSQITSLVLDRDMKKEELKSQQKIFNKVKIFSPLDPRVRKQSRYSFLETVTGQVEEKNLPIIKRELNPIPSVIMPFQMVEGKVMLLLIVLKKDKVVLEKAMRESSFEKVEIPEQVARVSGDMKEKIKAKIADLQKQVQAQELKIQDKRDEFYPDLMNFSKFLQAKQISAKAKAYFKKTEHTYLVSGWIPKNKKNSLIKAIKSLTQNNCYIEETDAEKVEAVKRGKVRVPVQFNNFTFLKPFEFLTSTFGVPEYNVIDPTIFLAVTFLIMFGAMFGDVGHGLVLTLLGGVFIRKKKPGFIKAGILSLYCGISSIIFGVLYGSYFGLEDFIPPLWMNPMRHIMDFITLAIFWGVGVISIVIVINLVNSFRNRDLAKGLFDKAGLIGGLIYWGAVGVVVKSIVTKEVGLNPGLVMGFVGIPVLLMFFKGPILKLFKPQIPAFPEGFVSYILDTIVELVEIFIGYLANTVSFIRVAAFALAHAGLFIAVFSLVDIVKQTSGGMFYSALVLIFGNALIIGLEGLIVTIQGLRLEYYEFFSKFFSGEGKEYKPIKIT